jgi:hypothetical protein
MRKLSKNEEKKLLDLFDRNKTTDIPATLILEFPLGELASENDGLRMILGFAHADGLIEFPIPITGKEGFAAQSLEGKARLRTTGIRALGIYAMLPEHRRALYRLSA